MIEKLALGERASSQPGHRAWVRGTAASDRCGALYGSLAFLCFARVYRLTFIVLRYTGAV